MHWLLIRGTSSGRAGGRDRQSQPAGSQVAPRLPRLSLTGLAVIGLLLTAEPPTSAAVERPAAPVTGHYWGLTGLATGDIDEPRVVAGLVRGLGVTHFRPVVRWSDIQPTGPQHWDWSETDEVFDAYRETGARALVLLNSGLAGWATDVSLLTADGDRSADCPPRILPGPDEPIRGDEPYYLFVREAVRRYGDVAAVWLIDNEASEPWSWAGNAHSYAAMVRLAAAAIHDADPAATVAMGAIPLGTVKAMVIADRLDDPSQHEFVVDFASRMWGHPVTIDEIQAIFDAPQFRVWDRVDFYRQALAVLPHTDALAGNVLGTSARGELAADIAWAYVDQMLTHGGGELPLIYTELNPYLSDDLALSQQTTQLMIGSLATGIVLGQAYHQFIDNSVERVSEPYCGLVTESLQPKMGYHAYRTLISLLAAAVRADTLPLPEPFTGYRFVTDQDLAIYALWASEDAEFDLRDMTGRTSVALMDMVGDPLLADTERVLLSPSPTYVVVSPDGMADIPFDHWAFGPILACLSADVVAGYPDGTYRPELRVTRDQMAAFIARGLAGSDAEVPTGPAQASFADVPVNHWAFRHVEYARAQGVVTGYPDGLYRPGADVDRAQMAVFVSRSLLGPGTAPPEPQGEPTFADVAPATEWAWCHRHVEHLARLKIVTGYPDGLYRPEYPCTRDQMAAYIARAFGLAH